MRGTTAAGVLASVCAAFAAGAPRPASAAATQAPSEGLLMVASERTTHESRVFPLAHTSVNVRVLGFAAQVRVRQTFNNPFKDPLEAIYVFPLPDGASVGDMSIRVGNRVIRGLIKTRQQAHADYEKAKRGGKITALLDQERPNIFRQAVANIEPGEDVIVELVYDVPLEYHSGRYEFVYPMVVGPRYIPGKPTGKRDAGRSVDTDKVPDASRITPPVKKPGSRSGHNVTVEVSIEPGMAVQNLWSTTHKIVVNRNAKLGPHAVTIRLAKQDRIPNKDFVLRYRLATKKPVMSIIAQKAETGSGGYFTLLFEPPRVPASRDVAPKEVVFVIDTSGAMRGEPMALIKRGMRYALRNLNSKDTFRIIRFSDSASALGPRPLANTPQNIRRALSYINGIAASGKTDMTRGIRAALNAKASDGRLRIICFMTDGYIGNEREILADVQRRIGPNTRLFPFGVGSAPNRFLLDRMADVGRGAAHYMLLDENPQDQIKAFYERIKAPVLTHVSIDWRGLDVSGVTPAQIPDVFAGQPVAIVGRYGKRLGATVKVSGRIGERPVIYSVPITFVPSHDGPKRRASASPEGTHVRTGNDSIARLWARARIKQLMSSQFRRDQPAIVAQITALALEYRLVSKYTSFVAIQETVVNEHGRRRVYQVPVEMPQGVAYDGVFGRDGDLMEKVIVDKEPDVDKKPKDLGDLKRDPSNIPPPADDPAPRESEELSAKRLRSVETTMQRGSGGASGSAPGSAAARGDYDDEDGVVFETDHRAVQARLMRPGYYRISLGAGFGTGTTGSDQNGGMISLSARVSRVIRRDLAVGGQLVFLLPTFDTQNELFVAAMLEIIYSNILGGLFEVSGGAGLSVPDDTELGMAYMGALDFRLPFGRVISPSLQLRLDGAILPKTPDMQTLSLGLRLSF